MGATLRKFQLLWLSYRRIVYVYLFLVLLPACGLLYFYFQKSSEVLEKQVGESMLNTVQQVKINVDYRLSKVSDVADSLILNEEVYTNLASDPKAGTGFDQVKEQRTLTNIITSLQGSDIHRIKLYVTEDKLYANEHVHFFNLRDAAEESWYADVISKSGAVHWIPTSLNAGGADGGQVLSLARMIRDPRRFERVIGIMKLDVPEKQLSAILSGAEDGTRRDTMSILDEGGRIVSHAEAERLNGTLLPSGDFAKIADKRTGIAELRIESEPYFLIYDTLEHSGWKVVSLVSVASIQRTNWESNSASTVVLVLSFLLLFILAAFLVFAFVMEGMVRRLRQMTSRLRLKGTDTIDEGIPNRRGVVVGLEKSVTHMLATFQQLMEENYETRMKEREAQLRALQSQINPHFLYNALDTINWMALTRGAQDISRMLNTLAQYFRLTLNKGKDIVTLEDEMNLARAYLEIQKQRFHNFEYQIEVDESLKASPIPKLTVQPLIENAILHGIQNKEGHQGRVTIRALPAPEGGYSITVTDDGIGMSEEKIQALLSGIRAQSPASYGLFNVFERIRLFTDNRGLIDIESASGEGTTVTVTIP